MIWKSYWINYREYFRQEEVCGYNDVSGTPEAAIGSSTDVAEYWPEDIRALAKLTYDALNRFATRCPCACPGGEATSVRAPDHSGMVNWVGTRWPGKNRPVGPQYPPPR
jgi:hypothetical protein